MPQAFYILTGAGLTLLTCYLLGRLLFSRLGLTFYREEEGPLALVSGAALLHLIVFAAACTGMARKGVVFAIAGAVLAAAWRTGAWRRPGERFPPLSLFWRTSLVLAYLAYGVVYWSNAMAPEISPDGSGYHLGLVSRYLRDHGFTPITTNMYASLTQGVEMLFLFAFAIGRHSAAALVHCGFTFALPLLVLSHGRRIGYPAPGAGAALLVLCSPLVGVDGTSAYNDVAAVSIVFAVYSLLRIWITDRNPKLLVPIGLLAGYAFASKYTVALAIPYAAGVVAWTLWRSRQPVLRPLSVFSACVAVMAGPWLLKNWLVTGNPLAPFFNRFFPNPNVYISFETEYMEGMRKYGEVTDWSLIPLDVTISGARLAGFLGPMFLLAPLALLALRQREGRRLLLAAGFFFLPYFNNIGARFLLPSLPFVALAMAMTLERTRTLLPLVAGLHALLSWPHVARHYCAPYAWRLERIPVAAALRITNEERFLSERSSQYSLARLIENHVPKGGKVFTFSGVPDAYTTREVLVAYQAALNNRLGDGIWAALYPGLEPNHHLDFQFKAKPLRRLRFWQTAEKPNSMWNISELRVFRDGIEAPRQPEWRMTAWPNHWDSPLAMDNNPTTRWSVRQPTRRGMYFEVDLGRNQMLDCVRLETVPDQWEVQLKLYGQSESGEWEELADSYVRNLAPPSMYLRRAAMEELRAHGIEYLLSAKDDPGWEDLRLNSQAWGIQKVAEFGDVMLYRLEETAGK